MNLNYTYIFNLLSYYLGGYDGPLTALAVFMMVNYITSIMCTIVNKKFSKEIGMQGICKKIVIFLLVGIANIFDITIIGNRNLLRLAVIIFYLANEGNSILNNAEQLGVPIPEKLKMEFKHLPNQKSTATRNSHCRYQ